MLISRRGRNRVAGRPDLCCSAFQGFGSVVAAAEPARMREKGPPAVGGWPLLLVGLLQRPDQATLRTEADLARYEIKNLREERDRLRDALRHRLGQQLDHLTGPDLAARTEDLATRNQQLTDQLQHTTTENTALRARVTVLEADLAAAAPACAA